MEKNKIVGGRMGFLAMGREESVDIDEPMDFAFVEFLIHRGVKK